MKTTDEIRDRLGSFRQSLELREELLADYMRARDWHGCEDAASDIRDCVAAIAALEWVLGKGAITAAEISPPDPMRSTSWAVGDLVQDDGIPVGRTVIRRGTVTRLPKDGPGDVVKVRWWADGEPDSDCEQWMSVDEIVRQQ